MNVLVTLSILLFSAAVTVPIAYAFDVFHKDEKPFNKPYEDWVEDWWRWTVAIPAKDFANVPDNGCLINREGPVVMLVDPAVGDTLFQRCEISSNQGILISAWGAVCSGASKGNEDKSFEDLLACAKGFNNGKVTVDVWVDNKPIAKVEADNRKTINITNADELSTKGFNVTIPPDSNLGKPENNGTHLGVADGWYIFLKPLPVGEHTVRYKNSVGPTGLEVENINNADITYSFKVK